MKTREGKKLPKLGQKRSKETLQWPKNLLPLSRQIVISNRVESISPSPPPFSLLPEEYTETILLCHTWQQMRRKHIFE